MINLKPLDGCDVLVQFKNAVYLIAHQGGRLVPCTQVDNPQAPIITDKLPGRLKFESDQPVLVYANPVQPSEQLHYYLDPDNVAGAWALGKITLISTGT